VHYAFYQGKKRMVFAHAYAFSWPKLRAALAHEDIPWLRYLPAKKLYP
jgi:hypothetical protein